MLRLDGKWPRPTISQRIGEVKVELGSGYVQIGLPLGKTLIAVE